MQARHLSPQESLHFDRDRQKMVHRVGATVTIAPASRKSDSAESPRRNAMVFSSAEREAARSWLLAEEGTTKTDAADRVLEVTL